MELNFEAPQFRSHGLPLSHFETHLVGSWDFPPAVRCFFLGILRILPSGQCGKAFYWPCRLLTLLSRCVWSSQTWWMLQKAGLLPLFYFGPEPIMCSKLSHPKDTLLSWLKSNLKKAPSGRPHTRFPCLPLSPNLMSVRSNSHCQPKFRTFLDLFRLILMSKLI